MTLQSSYLVFQTDNGPRECSASDFAASSEHIELATWNDSVVYSRDPLKGVEVYEFHPL